jgi:hypothetical protein
LTSATGSVFAGTGVGGGAMLGTSIGGAGLSAGGASVAFSSGGGAGCANAGTARSPTKAPSSAAVPTGEGALRSISTDISASRLRRLQARTPERYTNPPRVRQKPADVAASAACV